MSLSDRERGEGFLRYVIVKATEQERGEGFLPKSVTDANTSQLRTNDEIRTVFSESWKQESSFMMG